MRRVHKTTTHHSAVRSVSDPTSCQTRRVGTVALVAAALVAVESFWMGSESARAMTGNDTCAEAPMASIGCDTADVPIWLDNRPIYVGILPTTLYRVDATAPLGVGGAFYEGLPAAGLGLSLVDHVLAGPPLGNSHVFVGTTASPIVAARVAESIRASGRIPYVYTVRATESYFNVDQSLGWMAENDFAPEARRTRIARAQEMTAGYAQWVTPTSIRPDDIMSAREVTLPLNRDQDFREQNPDDVVYVHRGPSQPGTTQGSRQLLTW